MKVHIVNSFFSAHGGSEQNAPNGGTIDLFHDLRRVLALDADEVRSFELLAELGYAAPA